MLFVSRIKCIVFYLLYHPMDAYWSLPELATHVGKDASTCAHAVPSTCNVPRLPQFLFLFFKFIYLFLAALGLRYCTCVFSSCGEWGLLFIVVRGLLIVVASLVAEHRL